MFVSGLVAKNSIEIIIMFYPIVFDSQYILHMKGLEAEGCKRQKPSFERNVSQIFHSIQIHTEKTLENLLFLMENRD